MILINSTIFITHNLNILKIWMEDVPLNESYADKKVEALILTVKETMENK